MLWAAIKELCQAHGVEVFCVVQNLFAYGTLSPERVSEQDGRSSSQPQRTFEVSGIRTLERDKVDDPAPAQGAGRGLH